MYFSSLFRFLLLILLVCDPVWGTSVSFCSDKKVVLLEHRVPGRELW